MRSVVACRLEGATGQLVERRGMPDHRAIIAYVSGSASPVTATYEAGPTGFGSAQSLNRAGIDCLAFSAVAAPGRDPNCSGRATVARRTRYAPFGYVDAWMVVEHG